MSSFANLHTTTVAKKTRLIIRSAKPARRGAFALGVFGSFVVMFARRGKPATALAELRKMGPPNEAPPGDKKLPFRELTSGLLYQEGDGLVIQCKKRINAAQLAKARVYFKVLKVGRPWNKVHITRLAEDDEGDLADLADSEESEQGDIDEISDDGREDQVEDSWDEAPPAAARKDSASPAIEDDTSSAHEDDAPLDAERKASAQRVTRSVLQMAPLLKLKGNVSEEALEAVTADLLTRISPERLLLALCYSSNVEHLSSTAEERDADPGSGLKPITNDDGGHAEIADALAAYGARIALERGFMVAGETAKPGEHIQKMVAQAWRKTPQAPCEQVLQQLISVLGPTFGQVNEKRMRDLLGLPADKPAADAGWNKLARAIAGWDRDAANANSSVDQLKTAIIAEYKDEPKYQASIAKVGQLLDGFATHFNGAFKEALNDLLGAKNEDARDQYHSRAISAITEMQKFLETDRIASNLDHNAFVPSLSIIEPLRRHLDTMQDVLGRAA